ncbi:MULTISPECIES: DUF2103 domain-containing protein [unclassified Haladaptatus]|uniref:DUF2103 domain-containing protein n=1 Tax=unclassified Haladaptatus TaxID=2622732 RepID=UPI0023E82A87|nr:MULTISPECIES: DUF2103 domain-containing protein [unclassified Haladaptatus]
MNCRQCASSLERPGDYCLVCQTRNCDTVVLDVERDHATLTFLYEEELVGHSDVRTTPETAEELSTVELRNFAGRIADDLQRKRPDEVYATGDRAVIQAVRAQAHYDFYRVSGDDPVEAVLARLGEPALEVVELDPKEKLGGSHTTLIGERAGQKVIMLVAGHPNVKKIIPGPIDAGGSGSRTGVRAKATRADEHGNVRLLLRDGSSVQENRVVTTASDREMGERIRDDLNEALAEEGFQ